jgi:hypothetical protein
MWHRFFILQGKTNLLSYFIFHIYSSEDFRNNISLRQINSKVVFIWFIFKKSKINVLTF